MKRALIVVENPRRFLLEVAEWEVVPVREYLTQESYQGDPGTLVLNLCRSYRPGTAGYYASLLAEARGHLVLPSLLTMQDLRIHRLLRLLSDEQADLLQRSLGPETADAVTMRIYWGATPRPHSDRVARAVFSRFPAPLLQAEFQWNHGWRLEMLRPLDPGDIPDEEKEFALRSLRRYLDRPGTSAPAGRETARFDLAILFNPDEHDAPSDERTLQKFVKAGRALDMDVWIIGKEEAHQIAEYDALFLRETTAVDHHTYRIARRAEAEGLIVVDSPEAILRCTNKVYQAELFERHAIPCPLTRILHRENALAGAEEIGYPVVVKRPDSSFSKGVRKAESPAALETLLEEMFRETELLVAQSYVPSAYDWRIAALDGEFLFGCRYHMAPGHWQIQKTGAGTWRRYGKVEAVPPEEIPPAVLDAGLRAARLMGDSLYGVDVKEVDGKPLVMEVNDNPNIEAGYEDAILGDELYLRILTWFFEQLERRGRTKGNSA